MITKEQAMDVGNKHYGEFHHGSCKKHIGPRGGIKVFITLWRVNGKCKTWKTMPDRFSLPIKHGLYNYGYMTERNAQEFHFPEDCPLNKELTNAKV
jgi:hypothetical protein